MFGAKRIALGATLLALLCFLTATPAAAEPDSDALAPARTQDQASADETADAAADETADEAGGERAVSLAAARRLADEKRFDESASMLRTILQVEPKNHDARSLLARVLAWDRQYDASIAEYRILLADRPDHAFDRAGYARVLAWSGRTEASLPEFRRAIRSDSTDLEPRLGYARALSWAGDLPGAAREYRRILDANPRYGDAWLGTATVARWRGSATASDRFLERAGAYGADPEGLDQERDAVRMALGPSLAAGWTTSHERQYVDFTADFTIESTGPYALGRVTFARTAEVAVRAARLAQFERSLGPPVSGTTLNYDLDMTVLRADLALLRGYPFQIAGGIESRTLEAGSPNVIYPLSGDDDFFGWNARAWWFAGRFTPSVSARRDYLPIKSTTGPNRILAGDQTALAADLAYQWNARGSASAGIENGSYSDENERGTVRAGVAYKVRLARPTATLDYAIAATDFDSTSASYFTPRESVRHAVGLGVTGYSERAALDWGLRYQLAAVLSSNFEDIVTNSWTGHLNVTVLDAVPLGLEGSYSRDNNAYETWFLGVSAAVRW